MVEIHRKRTSIPGAAGAEAAGLRWLAEASDIVVAVHKVGENYLDITRIPTVSPTPDAARRVGRELARIHDAGAAAHGCPPEHWDGPNFIGTQPQECSPTEDWATFYAQQRVLPFARAAADQGTLRQSDLGDVEHALELLVKQRWDVEPARLHGDLWSGNVLFGCDGPVLIDPAAHGGHRETDLAMLALFGAPYLADIRAGYEEVHPLPQGWLDRTCIHQLHPLAVHALTHGAAYGVELGHQARAAIRVLS
ncbi:phosphotransferase [Corynebacterium poyangense]|uniref:Phosphotransferase n=1 Tax=Corynebacterium poyangense TaxID=2684405 RepID=A0A7H0SQT6_9CORY|nr:fructosamine kinase family protein [Corynebacterium poyangense]QNQ90911.1 phosphotransferase [Corynebacterium poyangense]